MSSDIRPGLTSASLLLRVRRLDADAWVRFSSLYGPVVYGWCRKAGLQDNDAADAVQDVFRSVFQGIAEFRGGDNGLPGGSFRGWLWTITRNQIRLFYRRQGSIPRAVGGTDAQVRFAEHTLALTDLADQEPDDGETHRRILHRAVDLIRGDFNESTWNAFSQVTLQGRSIQDVAADLGLTDNAVRQAKFRVLRRLREELDGML